MSYARTFVIVLGAHARRVAFSRRSLICGLLAGVPVFCAFALARLAKDANAAELVTHLGFLLQLQVVVPVLALVAGSAAIAEEVDDRTITFLFTRPVPRSAVFLGRWTAIAAFVAALLALSVLALRVAVAPARGADTDLEPGITQPLLHATLAGGIVYSALFASLGVFFRHSMIVGLAYAFAIEGLLANLPGGNQGLTIQFYLRSLVSRAGSASWNDVEGFASSAFATSNEAWMKLALVLVLALALGSWRLRRKQFVLAA